MINACLHACKHTCMHAHTHARMHTHKHTHTHTQPFYDSLDFVRDNPSEPVPEETFTNSHLSWSSVIPYLLPPSITIHGILFVQFTYLTVVFHSRSPSFPWCRLVLILSFWYRLILVVLNKLQRSVKWA